MKKILIIALALTTLVQSSRSQASPEKLSSLLTYYYGIKDALVAGNSTAAASQADLFAKATSTVDFKIISEGNINVLLKDATAISTTTDIKKQREHFSGLSSNMAALAKTVSFTTEPIYEAYCPMKKANWLSSEKEIKNPYYGKSMLTCGKVVDTIIKK